MYEVIQLYDCSKLLHCTVAFVYQLLLETVRLKSRSDGTECMLSDFILFCQKFEEIYEQIILKILRYRSPSLANVRPHIKLMNI